MKILEKIVLVCLIMCSFLIKPFAMQIDNSIIDQSNKGSITIYKYASKDGHFIDGTLSEQYVDDITNGPCKDVEFKYLKIGDLKQIFDNNDDASGLYYELSEVFINKINTMQLTITKTVINGKDYYTSEAVNSLMKSINKLGNAYDNNNNGATSGNEIINDWVNSLGIAMPLTDENGMTKVENLDLGLYLLAQTNSPQALSDGTSLAVAKASSPFLVSLPTTNITMINSEVAGSMWQYDVVAYPKNEMIGIRKDIIASGNDVEDVNDLLTVTTDKSVGEYVNFLLTLDVPCLLPITSDTPNKNRKYIIVDTLSSGLTIDDLSANNFKLTYGNNAYDSTANRQLIIDEDYLVDFTDQILTITLTSDGLSKFDSITMDCNLYVNYQARLNYLAAKNTNMIKEESNSFKLIYGTFNSADREFISNQDVKVYTYEIDITKSFSAAIDDISDVQFSLDLEDEALYFVKESDGIYHLYDGKETAEKVNYVNVSSQGKLIIKGLDAKSYVLTERKTMPGYNLMRDNITINLYQDNQENGTLSGATIQSDNDILIDIVNGLEQGQVNIAIKNNETITSLHTGGQGLNYGELIIGLTMLLASLVGFGYVRFSHKYHG